MHENPDQGLELVGLYPKSTAYTITETGTQEILVDVVNLTSLGDYFQLSVENVPLAWVYFSPSPFIFMEQGSKKQIKLQVTPPPGSAGTYDLKLMAVRKNDAAQAGEVHIRLNVVKAKEGAKQPSPSDETQMSGPAFQSRGRIGIVLDKVRFTVAPGETLAIPVQVTNQGLANDRFRPRLQSDDIPDTWVTIQPPSIELRSGQTQAVQVQIRPPKNHASKAGRYPFSIVFESVEDAAIQSSVDCVLTVTAFSQANIQVAPLQVFSGQPVHVKVENKGNTAEVYTVSWEGADKDQLVFEVLPPPPVVSSPAAPTVAVGMTRLHQVSSQAGASVMRVEPGKSGVLQFKAEPRSTPLLGRSRNYHFQTKVTPSDGQGRLFSCALTAQPLLPPWALITILMVCVFSFCALVWVVSRPGRDGNEQASTVETLAAQSLTETVAVYQTATAFVLLDSDGDGLSDVVEIELGTNPGLMDTDLDGLSDGDEVNNRKTNPTKADSDEDGLTDGDEISRGINPLLPDTDGDGLRDSEEIRLGADPKANDSDQDGLSDGAEASTCTSPIDSDSDDDNITDGQDLDPCNRDNPALTQTAYALIPTATLTPTPTVTPTPVPVTSTPTPSATPTPPSLTGSLVFSSNREGRPQIYHRDMDNGNITRLTVSNGDDTLPAWSPDGSQVAFTTNRDGNQEIYLMDANGANQINLTNHSADDVHPTWSPDGNWIAFSSNRNGNAEIYAMRADGSEVHNISNHPANDVQPFWGMTSGAFGEQEVILFVTDRDNNLEIYTMQPDGSTPFNLTNDGASDYQPALSVDGGRIAFVSERSGNADIFIMDTDGSDPLNLTQETTYAEEAPTWSGDNQWIACSVNLEGDYELFVIRIDSSGLRYNITAIPSKDQDPAWR